MTDHWEYRSSFDHVRDPHLSISTSERMAMMWRKDEPRVKLVSTLLSHQFPSLSAVFFKDVASFTISRSFDGLDILIAVLTVDRTSAIVLGWTFSWRTFSYQVTCLFSRLL